MDPEHDGQAEHLLWGGAKGGGQGVVPKGQGKIEFFFLGFWHFPCLFSVLFCLLHTENLTFFVVKKKCYRVIDQWRQESREENNRIPENEKKILSVFAF